MHYLAAMAAPWTTPLHAKSSSSTIRDRFESDVERFSSLESGQAAVIDARLMMDLISEAAVAASSPIRRVLDIGCGAGNNTLRLQQVVGHPFEATLNDLSPNMLAAAETRLAAAGFETVETVCDDFRTLPADRRFDVILAAAVLHHLRDESDWQQAFAKLYELTAPGGSVWITDLVRHELAAIDDLMWDRYDDHLRSVGGEATVRKVREYVDAEDSPRPVTWQLDLLRSVGFAEVELLHKSSCFAAFGARRTE